jgi:hypothetical protein
MFDTSVFNFIDEQNLYSDIEAFFSHNKNISVYVCDTQLLEIGSIANTSKKERIGNMIKKIPLETVICSLGYVGTNKPSHRLAERGFRVGRFRVADINESKHREIEKLERDTSDVTILHTAITEEMDHLVTCDLEMKTRLHELLRKVSNYSKPYPQLKIKLIEKKEDLLNFLNAT